MIAIVNSQLLAAELRLLNKVVPTKPAIQILSHALFQADGEGSQGRLSLYATDHEVALSGGCEARVEQPGEAALPVAKLLAMVEQFPDGDVRFSFDGARTVISCGAFTSRLNSLPVEDFPTPPQVEGQATVVDAAALRGLIAKTRHAVSATGTKYVLKGALLELTGTAAIMVATEGKRLALATAGRSGPDLSVVVPMKTLDVLAGGTDEGDVTLTLGMRHLFFAVGDRLLTSRRMEGDFPQYRRIVPTDNDKVVTLDRGQLTAALKRVVLAAEDNGAVYFYIEAGRVGLSAASVGLGSANEVVAAGYDGPPLKVFVNGSFVLEFLESSVQPTVTMSLKDARSSMLLSDGDDHLGVILLMRA